MTDRAFKLKTFIDLYVELQKELKEQQNNIDYLGSHEEVSWKYGYMNALQFAIDKIKQYEKERWERGLSRDYLGGLKDD